MSAGIMADKGLYAAKRLGRNRVMRSDMIPADMEMRAEASRHGEAPAEAGADTAIPFHAVTALMAVMSHRYPETAEHSKRVAHLCVATAKGVMSHRERYVVQV